MQFVSAIVSFRNSRLFADVPTRLNRQNAHIKRMKSRYSIDSGAFALPHPTAP
jgi:hypothetical protein